MQIINIEKMIDYTIATSDNDLKGILSLQVKNHIKSLSDTEAEFQGFVTVEHSYDLLKKLNDTERHIIAKENDKVVGYVLSMTKKARLDIPILYPMFQIFDQAVYNEKTISDSNYIIVGQVCVDKDFRGQGIFDNCYNTYKKFHEDKYDFAITEIAEANLRSLNAHKRVGFLELTSYKDANNTKWIVVIWAWKNSR